jgi:outer membrane protein insertion porin family
VRVRRPAALLLACLLWAASVRPAAAEGFRVVSIEVQGARRVSPESILQAMATRTGQDLDLARVREDVKAIYRMGYFRDVTFDTEEVPGGYRLTVIVVEKPLVGSVRIEGNKEVETSDLRAAVTLKDRTLFQEEKVKESIAKALEVCQNKGFYDATVEADVSVDAEGAVRVTFRVTEGKKLAIERIVVTGNYYYSEKAIRKVMDSSERGFFSFITDSGTYKRDVLEIDVRKIEAMYHNNGFLDSKVFDPEVSRGKDGLVVTMRVFEGRQYRVGEIRFAGESGVPEEKLRAKVAIARGDVFSREKLLSDLLALTNLVNDQGYAQALVAPTVEKRKEYPLADVTYRFDRGAKFRFGKVEISGNTKTLDRIVRRNVEVYDSQTYTATGLKESKENLTRTGYFKDVKISTEPSKTPGEMDVKVDVQEGPTGTLSGGAGYSSLDKVFGVIQVSEQNLLGYGWNTTFNSNFGARRTTFTLNFRDPYFLGTDYSLLLSLYKTKVQYSDYEKSTKGGLIGVGTRLSRFVSGNVSYADYTTQISALSGVPPSLLVQEQIALGVQQTRAFGINVTRNTTDRPLDPSRGSIQSVTLDHAGGVLGGDSKFFKYFLAAKAYYPVFGATTFSWNFLWGHVIPNYGGWGSGEVPLAERFFLGGPYSVRGFKARSLSPVDPVTGEQIGGNKELIVNLEYTFPIVPDIGFKGVFFADAGNAWAQSDWPFNRGDLIGTQGVWVGYGVGVRWYSPMGPLRLEYGWNVNAPPGAPNSVLEFTIGTAF